MYTLKFTKLAIKDSAKIKTSGLSPKTRQLLDILRKDPLQNPPGYEKLVGDLAGLYSRRINIKHRLVYQILEDQKIVKVLRMWTHYQ